MKKRLIIGTLFVAFLFLLFAQGEWFERTEFLPLFGIWTGLFVLYLVFYRHRSTFTGVQWFLLAIVARLVLVPVQPNLTDDHYRYLWDGNLTMMNIDVLETTPRDIDWHLLKGEPTLLDLRESMNSPEYYTVYPGFSQTTFFLAASVGNWDYDHSVLSLKLFTILFEIGSLVFLLLMFKNRMSSSLPWLLYALNPLVLIELSGNLHTEYGMIFGLLGMSYFIDRRMFWLGGVDADICH